MITQIMLFLLRRIIGLWIHDIMWTVIATFVCWGIHLFISKMSVKRNTCSEKAASQMSVPLAMISWDVWLVKMTGRDTTWNKQHFIADNRHAWSHQQDILPIFIPAYLLTIAFSALTLLIGRQEQHPASQDKWWDTGAIICLEWGANDFSMVQPMPLPCHSLLLQCLNQSRLV